jgi:molybdopterin synthase catalytic subunit
LTIAVVTDAPIDAAAVRDAVVSAGSGALVEFSGIVRDHDGERTVLSLDYEAHPDAAAALAECCRAIAAETGVAVSAVHRVGSLRIGDLALFAAAASAHRAEAFAACAALVDRIKAEVPIWKRQHFADGASEWVGL